MFYLEDEKTLVLTSENKKDILNALKLINNISDNKNIKVAYIKILGKVLEFNKAIETYYHAQKHGFDKKADREFNSILTRIESRISIIFEHEEQYNFNNYLITLIEKENLDEFIWLNTIYNIYKEGKSLNSIVQDYTKLSDVEFSDLYKIYLFVTDYNINKLLLKNESKIINNDYLENHETFFNYMYKLIDDLRTFVAKNEKKNILSFSTIIESHTNITTPTKDEFLKCVYKVFNFLRALYENDNAKLLLDNIYPILVKSFFAPLRNDDKIKYDYNQNFIYALEYTQIIIEVMDDKHE